jgi:hypothetical protein
MRLSYPRRRFGATAFLQPHVVDTPIGIKTPTAGDGSTHRRTSYDGVSSRTPEGNSNYELFFCDKHHKQRPDNAP